MGFGTILGLIQFAFAVIIGLYFLSLLRSQQGSRIAINRDSRQELEKLTQLRNIRLTEPLSEKTRPSTFDEIVGQQEALRALRAALCGPNPQHVILYGPPGVGKTAAARLVLEEAKRNPLSPFKAGARFIELDATTARFDERGIADPLIGSVHDPIYQGAGPMGMAGIPQPKPGAVTRAHGGILFIDEIGELHPVHMNRLLKVLEDRKVFLESAYYTPNDPNIPRHIQDVFDHGLPADFRLVGATTRLPQDIPPALRSRCLEIYFRALVPEEIRQIAANAVAKIGFTIAPEGLDVVTKFAANGREVVNIVQIAAGIAQEDGRNHITTGDIEWVVNSGQYQPRIEKTVPPEPQVGVVNALAVWGPNLGTVVEVEVAAAPARDGAGDLLVTGMIEEEEMGQPGRTVRRKSTARGAVDAVRTVLYTRLGIDVRQYDVHINFSGGVPIDGPSAGVAVACAVYSAVTNVPVKNTVAMTGELSVRGLVRPVGGLAAKIEAGRRAGASEVLIPQENWQSLFATRTDIRVTPVRTIEDVLAHALVSAAHRARTAGRPEVWQEKAAVLPSPEVTDVAAGAGQG